MEDLGGKGYAQNWHRRVPADEKKKKKHNKTRKTKHYYQHTLKRLDPEKEGSPLPRVLPAKSMVKVTLSVKADTWKRAKKGPTKRVERQWGRDGSARGGK